MQEKAEMARSIQRRRIFEIPWRREERLADKKRTESSREEWHGETGI
jgi:hypothetical protein